MDDDRRLSSADEALLKNLRQQADNMSERQYRKDAGPNARNEYWYAAEELKAFVNRLRKEGKNI